VKAGPAATLYRMWKPGRVLECVALVSTLSLVSMLSSGGDKARMSFEAKSRVMVERQIEARGVADSRVLVAMRETPRHLFVPEDMRDHAYEDRPLPIGSRQTISQPYIVAFMTELLDPQPDDVVLEIGTGSGYQAAVLSRLVKRVVSIEILAELAEDAKAALAEDGRENVEVIVGDGYKGLPERAPFQGIIVTAAPPDVPPPLIEQLAVGARLVIPVGEGIQELLVIERTESGVTRRSVLPVRFVPMTGEAQNH
jgi:protein-L-isoaspartate(D-aspartate) O-methyltransferase